MPGTLFTAGAAGGGKSDFLLGDFLLEELIARSKKIYPRTGYMRSHLRSAGRQQTLCGPGHLEVKRYFVDPAPGGKKVCQEPL